LGEILSLGATQKKMSNYTMGRKPSSNLVNAPRVWNPPEGLFKKASRGTYPQNSKRYFPKKGKILSKTPPLGQTLSVKKISEKNWPQKHQVLNKALLYLPPITFPAPNPKSFPG